MATNLKVIVLGPCKSGKTLLSNTLADMIDSINELQYDPTEGLRILEVELQLAVNVDNLLAEIQLWDCSGNQKYQSFWPVMQLDVDGIIFVYNPSVANHLIELELIYDYFVIQGGFSSSQCLLIANLQNKSDSHNFSFSKKFDMTQKSINVGSDSLTLKSIFSDFIETLVSQLQMPERRRITEPFI